MLQQHGLQLQTSLALSDHADLSELKAALQRMPPGLEVLCTEKDAVKLWASHPDVWAVPLQSTLPEALLTQIDSVLASKLSLAHGQQIA
jgi:tetraacyldisaccharide 4'-kinase